MQFTCLLHYEQWKETCHDRFIYIFRNFKGEKCNYECQLTYATIKQVIFFLYYLLHLNLMYQGLFSMPSYIPGPKCIFLYFCKELNL